MAEYNLGTARGRIEIDSGSAIISMVAAGTAAETMESKMQRSSAAVGAIGVGIASIGIAVVGSFGYAVKVAGDFEEKISAIGAVSGATEKQIDTLRQKSS